MVTHPRPLLSRISLSLYPVSKKKLFYCYNEDIIAIMRVQIDV